MIAGNKVIGAGGVSAFYKNVVIRVAGHIKSARWNNHVTAIFDQLEELEAKPLADHQFRPGKDLRIFFENRGRHIKTGRFCGCQQESCPLETFRLKGSLQETDEIAR